MPSVSWLVGEAKARPGEAGPLRVWGFMRLPTCVSYPPHVTCTQGVATGSGAKLCDVHDMQYASSANVNVKFWVWMFGELKEDGSIQICPQCQFPVPNLFRVEFTRWLCWRCVRVWLERAVRTTLSEIERIEVSNTVANVRWPRR